MLFWSPSSNSGDDTSDAHPVFAQFQENCDAYTPTKDNDQFSYSMSEFFERVGVGKQSPRDV